MQTEGGRCSGTLVTEDLVLTASHCTNPVAARFGQVTGVEAFPLTVPFVECWSLPTELGLNDVQVCLLEEAQPEIPIIPLLGGPEGDYVVENAPIVVVGYGRIEAGLKSDTPSVVNRSKHSGDTVISGFGLGTIITASAPRDTICFGDSGGPAFTQLPDNSWRQVGVASWSLGGCEGHSGFADVRTAIPPLEELSGWDLTPLYDGDICTFEEVNLPGYTGRLWGAWENCEAPEVIPVRCTDGLVFPINPPEEEEPPNVGCQIVEKGRGSSPLFWMGVWAVIGYACWTKRPKRAL